MKSLMRMIHTDEYNDDDDGVVVDISWMHFVLLTKEPEGHKMYVSLQKIPSKLEVAPHALKMLTG